MEARATLIERNLRLVVYIAKKFENSGVNIEDLISIGTIGLVKAVNTFKIDKEIKLATYASRCIENDLVYNEIEEDVNRKLLKSALTILNDREKQIMEMRYGLLSGHEMTQKEVASRMGISQSYISRSEKRIISRLQKEVKKLG